MGGEPAAPEQESSGSSSKGYPQLAEKPVGQWIPRIYKDRIAGFTSGGQYASKNLLS